MKRLIIGILALMLVFQPKLKADEGMWLPFLVERLNYEDMQKMGLQLTPEEIYSVNNSSIKDAIVQFGNGCTGEIISEKGLILTNHHCGHGNIQEHSTTENDYLEDGFWARSLEEELPNEDFSVSFLIRVEDVTDKVLENVNNDMEEKERNNVINEQIKKIKSKATEDNDYKAVLKSFFDGNAYYMFIMEEYPDVRLVGAPPSSIGNFGGDTDNWMWPRHTGDFSLFRVYTAPDGSPAEYSEDNIPMKPKHHLPISIDGVEPGDFSMIMGYPGGTDRYMTSYGINQNLDKMYPTRIKIRRKKLDIMDKYMENNSSVKIKYSSKRARVSNYWKNFIGMSKALKDLKIPQEKEQLEERLTNWINQSEERKEKYGKALPNIKEFYKASDNHVIQRYHFIEAIYLGPEVIGLSRQFEPLASALDADEKDDEKIEAMIAKIKSDIKKHFKDYYKPLDKDMMTVMFRMYSNEVPENQQPELFKKMVKKHDGDFEELADNVYSKSMFDSKKELIKWLDDPKLKTLKKDPVYELKEAFFEDFNKMQAGLEEANLKKDKGRRLFMQALRKMDSDKTFYPDANFTLRLTYGKVAGYKPEDAVTYRHYTTLQGIMEKEDPDNKEFIVPEKLKELYKNKNYGPYGEGEEMHVCFLTDHDITGGNSGSPVIDGDGNLVGLAFDGNWEAMSGDIAFEDELQRTINADIRYVLFVIDKFAGAQNIIDELDIVQAEKSDKDRVKSKKMKDKPEQEKEIKEAEE
ncbi:MAG: S46 family peptidase [Bacteroidales bacterium]